MVLAKPHFLLFCDAHVSDRAAGDSEPVGGRWHFVLERIDINERLEAADSERAQPRERLALLAVVRGLEAIEMPSQVTLVTTSRYVSRGLRYGLSEWREANYSWEHFGVQKPIRNADLWQRIDGAMQYHDVACRLLESSLASLEAAPALCPEAAAEPPIPAPHFLAPRLADRAAANVARVERPRYARREPAWWPMAAGWLQWWRGRAGRPSLLAGV
jgi:ribonuclease HI